MIISQKNNCLIITAMMLILPLIQGCGGNDDLKATHVKVSYFNRGCGGIVLVIQDPGYKSFGAAYGCGVAGCQASAVWVQKSLIRLDNLKDGGEYYVDMKRIKPVSQPYCDIYPGPPEISVLLLKVY